MSVYDERQNNLGITVDRLEKDIQDYKSSQKFGSQSVRIYHIQTNNTWDVQNAVLPTMNASSQWKVTFTPTYPDYYVEFELNWQMVMYPTNFDMVYYWDDSSDFSATNSKSFIVWTQNDYMNNQQLNLKFGFKTTSPGTITWVRQA